MNKLVCVKQNTSIPEQARDKLCGTVAVCCVLCSIAEAVSSYTNRKEDEEKIKDRLVAIRLETLDFFYTSSHSRAVICAMCHVLPL